MVCSRGRSLIGEGESQVEQFISASHDALKVYWGIVRLAVRDDFTESLSSRGESLAGMGENKVGVGGDKVITQLWLTPPRLSACGLRAPSTDG
jgi:hypothetical protein